MINGCEPGDVLLVEQVDRLSRLTPSDWVRLRGLIDAKQAEHAQAVLDIGCGTGAITLAG